MIKIINTTPHAVTMVTLETGEVYSVPPCGTLINAKPVEITGYGKRCGATLVSVRFVADEANTAMLEKLEQENPNAIIIGSMIAAQAFPGRVLAMIAAPGFERVPPDQKRVRDDRFTIFETPRHPNDI